MPSWLVYALFLWVILAITDLVYRKLFGLGYDPITLVFWSTLVALIVTMGFLWASKTKVQVPRKGLDIGLFFATGVLFFVGFYLLRKAQKEAPNLGVVNAVVYSSVIATLLLMRFVYGDALTWHMILGGVLIVCGIGVIGLGK